VISCVEVSELAPVSRQERISSVDLVRGFALLGILLMNIIGFSFPGIAYGDPSVIGGATGWNLYTWAINYILFEGKMRALFSMLFGAGIIIFTTRLEAHGAGVRTADLYYRRNLWLMAFGLIHVYFFWGGDVLYPYGLTALFLFPFRNVSPKWLIILGVLILGVVVPGEIMSAREAQRMSLEERMKKMKPRPERLQRDIDAHRGSFIGEFQYRAPGVTNRSSIGFYRSIFFDCCGMILIGMGLFKLGFLSANWSYREYALVALIGYAVGITMNSVTAWRFVHSGYDPLVQAWAEPLYHIERLVVGLAHAAVLLIVSKAGVSTWLTSRLAAVGQMAITNYLVQTLVCTTIFDRLRFFGQWQRYQVYYVVAAIWVFQLAISKPWLEHFRFGPVEWFWRSLTYWKRQPMRIEQPAPAAEVPLGLGVPNRLDA